MLSRLRLVCLASLLLLMAACGGKSVPPRDGSAPSWMGTIADLRQFPQNLEVYAKNAGQNKRLISQAEQNRQLARFDRIFFGPWEMRKTSMRKRDVAAIFNKARGYKQGSERWTQTEWDAMARNANLKNFPTRAQTAITVRNTDLREMPTHLTRFSEPTPDPRANPFDYFQYSLLPLGTPVLIAHTSSDGRWHFVECPIAGGWVDAEDLALVDDSFMSLYRNASFAAVVRDNVRLTDQTAQYGASASTGGQNVSIGTILPALAGGGVRTSIMPSDPTAPSVTLLAPVKDSNGMARTAPFTVSSSDVVARPLPLTPDNVAAVGNVMMGQRYGWGGMFGERDCSALTRDLFTPFGIWLPRNSGGQARVGAVSSLEGMAAREKEDTILRYGVPFLSLVGMRGHIMLYVGKYDGRPAIFHNVWGVRTVEGNDDNARFVIGRAVVTSITPGSELKNLYRGTTFVDRLRTLSTPADTLQ